MKCSRLYAHYCFPNLKHKTFQMVEMESIAQQRDPIPISDLQPGISLIDTYQNKEKVIRQVQTHGTFVQLFLKMTINRLPALLSNCNPALNSSRMLFAQMQIW